VVQPVLVLVVLLVVGHAKRHLALHQHAQPLVVERRARLVLLVAA
jgi:hypothetical protein